MLQGKTRLFPFDPVSALLYLNHELSLPSICVKARKAILRPFDNSHFLSSIELILQWLTAEDTAQAGMGRVEGAVVVEVMGPVE